MVSADGQQPGDGRTGLPFGAVRTGVFEHDLLTDACTWSPDHYAIFGWPQGSCVSSERVIAAVHPDDREAYLAALAASRDPAGDGSLALTHRIVRPDGETVWVDVHAHTVFAGEHAARRPLRTIGATADVSDRLHAERELRASERRLRQAIRVGDVGVFDRDLETGFVYWGPELRRIYGVSEDEPAPVSIFLDNIHPDDRERILALRTAALEPDGPGGFDCTLRWVRADGDVRWLMIRSETIFRRSGGKRYPGRTVGAVIDVTEQKRAEEKIRELNETLDLRVKERTRELEEAHATILRQEKLSMLGQLNATVSHELRNPLGIIRNAVRVIDAQVRGREPLLDRALDRIERGILRCDGIIDELLEFSRSRRPEFVEVDLRDYLDELLGEFPLPAEVDLHTDFRFRGTARIAPDLLRRCLLNVIDNAVDAMLETTPAREAARHRLTIGTHAVGDEVHVTVEDTGPGIAPEDLERVFEPLVSSMAFGIGLGLAIVRQIMHDL
ncbi:MAG: PAS domain-containing protein, partial [Gammaproteobacteria bacterium]